MTHKPVRPGARTPASPPRARWRVRLTEGGHMDSRTSRRRLQLTAVVGTILVTAALAAPAVAQASGFRQVNLVSDKPGLAMLTDSNLVNPWGLSAGPTTPLWIADNGTDVSSIYPGATHGMPISIAPLVVSIPGGAPTGTVFNPSPSFKVHVGNQDLPATFLFDSEAGMITAWPFTNPPGTSATAELSVPDAIFKGLALGFVHGRGHLLYAADFHHNQIVVVNGRFHRTHVAGGFHDPNLPHGFAPFNIQNIGGKLYVAYAKQDPAAEDEIAGAGLGFVDVYSRDGHLLHRLASRGALDAPWGLVKAPAGFGRFGGALLVGNFGNGKINAYNIRTGRWLGELRRPNGHAVEIDGLWGLRFGNGVTGDRKTLLFSAGIDDEAHGLFGMIRAAR
jgi:uncharacterized protein (TIGR03118 family)